MNGRTLAGKYRIERLLGEGGVGAVYFARGPDDAPVALKLLHRTGVGEDRFRREAEVVDSLRHPGIVALRDFGVDPEVGAPYLVMDYVVGDLLSELARQPMRWQDAVDLVRQVAEAVGYAHDRGVVHRDLKPDNIILTQRDGRSQPVVLDFGLAWSAEQRFHTLTQDGTIFGTPDYMAPEQARTARVDARADVYSLGTILFELLTGTTPFDSAGSAIATLVERQTSPAPPVNSRRRGPPVPEELERVVAASLATAPEHRPPDGAAFAQALRGVLHGQAATTARETPVAAPVAAAAPTPTPTAQGGSSGAVLGIVTALVAFAVVGAGIWFLAAPDDPPSVPEPLPDVPPIPAPAVQATGGTEELGVADVGRPDAGAGDVGDDASDHDFGDTHSVLSAGCADPVSDPSQTRGGGTVYRPRSAAQDEPLPLVLVAVDFGMNSKYALDTMGFREFADRHRAVLLFPPFYRLDARAEFGRAVFDGVEQVEREVCIDLSRRYAIGIGRGERGIREKLRGLPLSAAFGAGYRIALALEPLEVLTATVPYLHVDARDDTVVPYSGGQECAGRPRIVTSAREQARLWWNLYGCTEPQSAYPLSQTDAECYQRRCPGAPFVYCVAHGGQLWPGETKRESSSECPEPPKPSFDYLEAAWHFFETEGLPIETDRP